jgi:hypothetical protein
MVDTNARVQSCEDKGVQYCKRPGDPDVIMVTDQGSSDVSRAWASAQRRNFDGQFKVPTTSTER